MSRTYRNRPIDQEKKKLVAVRDGQRFTAVSPKSSKRFKTASEEQTRHQSVQADANHFTSLVHDGQSDTKAIISRDNRGTGFRDHKDIRTKARQDLKTGVYEKISTGKIRRYGYKYGQFLM